MLGEDFRRPNRFLLVGLVMFFNTANLDTKSWRRETVQTQTGLDTSGSVDHSSMNFVGQMPTRRSTTSSKTSIPNWFSPRTICERST